MRRSIPFRVRLVGDVEVLALEEDRPLLRAS